MANNNVVLSTLDFNTNKQNFKNFLASQAVFKDYNFEGSNMSVLLDILSYNTYMNAFYLNMVASEMFMDSAQKYNSVVSHAKELNYVPKSAKSSVATISFTTQTLGISSPFIVPKGTSFTGSNANGTFNFVTNQLHSYISSNSTFTIDNLPLYQGTYITDSFIKDDNIPNQRFVISNPNIDVDSLTVLITQSGTTNPVPYTKVESLFDLDETSLVYFLQVSENGKYEIIFGDGHFGYIPKNLSLITAEYIAAVGPSSDGISVFGCNQDLGIPNGGVATLSVINATTNSSSGSLPETLESIRFAAPRYFATQQRAVSSDDYVSLVKDKFGGQIGDVSVYGGETLEPKQYGKVVIALKPTTGLIVAQTVKDSISNYLQKYVSLPTRLKTADPEYVYLKINSEVQYDKTLTTKLPNELIGNIRDQIRNFSTSYLEKFGNDFRYSKFVSTIDSTNSSIVSNNTKVLLSKRIAPLLNYKTSFDIDFNNPADNESESPGYSKINALSDEPMITSSAFTYVDSDGAEWQYSYIRDNNLGKLLVYSIENGQFTIHNDNIGTIDYVTGKVYIKDLVTSYYGNHITINLYPLNKDVIINKAKILLIDPNDVTINLIEKQA